MKSIIYTLLALVSMASSVHANQIFALKSDKDGRSYSNTLQELDAQSGEVIKQVKLTDSNRFSIDKLALPSHPKMVFYAPQGKKQATVQIVDRADINQIHTLNIDELNTRPLANYELYRFYHLTDDQRHLLMHTGHKKKQQVIVIDLHQGKIIKQLPVSKFKNTVSLSDDGEFLLINDISKDELTVVRMSDFSVALTSKLGEFRAYGIIHDDHLYLTKYSGKDRRKEYWIQTLNLTTGEKTDVTMDNSSHIPVFAVNPTDNALYTLLMTDRNRKAQWASVKANQVKPLAELELKMDPKHMSIDGSFQKAFVRGAKRVATIDLNDLAKHTVTKLPFDTTHHFYNSSGDLLYLKEGSGSEVAVIDVATGELIERSGTGRAGVKFGQFMASVALAGVGANFGYMVYFGIYSNTGFSLNHDEDKLYVINSKTNDVTHFNARDLSDRKAIATGGGTFLVYPGQADGAPLWVFSNKRINQINDERFELEQEIEYDSLVGFDMVTNEFVIKTTDAVVTYDMNTGQVINQWNLSAVDAIWSEQ
jgi:hypothetical protein